MLRERRKFKPSLREQKRVGIRQLDSIDFEVQVNKALNIPIRLSVANISDKIL